MPQSAVTDMVSAVCLFVEILRKLDDHDERLRTLEGRKTVRRPQERRTNHGATIFAGTFYSEWGSRKKSRCTSGRLGSPGASSGPGKLSSVL